MKIILLSLILFVTGCTTKSSSFGNYNNRNVDIEKIRNSKTNKICKSTWFDTMNNPDRYIKSEILPQIIGKTNPIFIEYTLKESIGAPVYKEYCVTIYE